MKLIFIEFIIASQLLFAQLPSYDISEVNVSKFSSSITQLIKSSSFSLGHHQLVSNNLNQDLSVSIIFPMGYDLTNKSFIGKSIMGLPLFHGSLLISNNLRINGKIGGFTSDNDVINYYCYGFFSLFKTYIIFSFKIMSFNFCSTDSISNFCLFSNSIISF